MRLLNLSCIFMNNIPKLVKQWCPSRKIRLIYLIQTLCSTMTKMQKFRSYFAFLHFSFIIMHISNAKLSVVITAYRIFFFCWATFVLRFALGPDFAVKKSSYLRSASLSLFFHTFFDSTPVFVRICIYRGMFSASFQWLQR